MTDRRSSPRKEPPIPSDVLARRWSVVAILTFAMFMVMLDATIVNVAMAEIMRDLDATVSGIQWVMNAYVLVLACSLITFGRLGDIAGRKLVFLLGLALFTGASLACAFAPGLGSLIAFRAVQGLGGALMIPTTLSLLTVIFPPEQLGTAIGVWAAVNGLATAAGPSIGGLIIDRLEWSALFGGASWPWVFLINVPMGVVLLALGAWMMPESRDHAGGNRLDLLGTAVLTVALLPLTYALIEGETRGWSSALIIACFVVAGVALVAFVVVERGRPSPLIPLRVFRSRTFSAANATGFMMSFALGGCVFLLPVFFQLILGYSALKTGLLLTPLSGGLFLGSPIAGRLSDKVGPRWPAIAGLLIAGAGLIWLQDTMTLDAGWRTLVWPLLVSGFGVGFIIAPVGSAIMGGSHEGAVGAASGIYLTVRQFGTLMAVASLGALFQSRTATAIHEVVAERLDDVADLPAQLKTQLIAAAEALGRSLGADDVPPALAKAVRELPLDTQLSLGRAMDPRVIGGAVVDSMQTTMLVSAAALFSGVAAAALMARPVSRHSDSASVSAMEP